MPGMTGLELLPHAKAILPDLPIIMITAYGDAATLRHAREGGADDRCFVVNTPIAPYAAMPAANPGGPG
jgi:CheY-like chemotaxis protein